MLHLRDIIEKFDEMIKKHGILAVCCAGNGGPALSTGSALGSTSSYAIGLYFFQLQFFHIFQRFKIFFSAIFYF